MAKWQNDLIYDNGTLNYIEVNITKITVCDAQPATYAAATTSSGDMLALGSVITSTDTVLAAGDATGRKVTIPADNGITVLVGGTATHVAWVGSTASILLAVTTCVSQVLTSGNSLNVPAHDFEIADVT